MASNFLSLFSGAGGLDIGLEQAGWDCLYASDIDIHSVATLIENSFSGSYFKNCFVEQADVRELDAADILAKAGVRRGDIRLLAGGPPCQSWSSAGHQLGFSDPRGQLFNDYVRLANQLDVELLIFENVRGLLTARGFDGQPGSALTTIRKALLNAGFHTSVHLLNAAEYGIPQRRVRLFIVGHRGGHKFSEPVPTHSKKPDPELELLPWKTLGECLGEIEPIRMDEVIRPSGKMALELKNIQAGSGVKSRGKIEATRPGGHWGYKQGAFVVDPELPARTVTASGQQDWLRDPKLGLRRLCPRECAAIQTFPVNWKFEGTRSQQYKQIGNAVPPMLAKIVGDSLMRVENIQIKQQDIIQLQPLPDRLQAAIDYTCREERRNGASRNAAKNLKRINKKLVSTSLTA